MAIEWCEVSPLGGHGPNPDDVWTPMISAYVARITTNVGVMVVLAEPGTDVTVLGVQGTQEMSVLVHQAIQTLTEEERKLDARRYAELLVKLLKTPRARLDASGKAKPLTRIVHHPNPDNCVGPGVPLVNPEYEGTDGKRVPLGTRKNWEEPLG